MSEKREFANDASAWEEKYRTNRGEFFLRILPMFGALDGGRNKKTQVDTRATEREYAQERAGEVERTWLGLHDRCGGGAWWNSCGRGRVGCGGAGAAAAGSLVVVNVSAI